MERDFNFYIPLDITKDKDGNYKIKGLASTEDMDLQGEIIKHNGLDISVLKGGRGYLNWEHKNDPSNIIGLINDADVTKKGLEIEGELFKNHDQAKAVYQMMSSLDDARKHRVQLSVEGKVLEKSDPVEHGKPKVINKAKITAVALTMNPVNQKTYAELVKSLAGGDSTGDELPSSFSSPTPPDNEVKKDLMAVVKDKLDDEILNYDADVIVEELFSKAEELEVDPTELFDEMVELMKGNQEAEEKFNQFIESLQDNPFAIEIIKAMGHKYIKRTGGPGNYKYWYRDEKGKMVAGKKPAAKEGGKLDGIYNKFAKEGTWSFKEIRSELEKKFPGASLGEIKEMEKEVDDRLHAKLNKEGHPDSKQAKEGKPASEEKKDSERYEKKQSKQLIGRTFEQKGQKYKVVEVANFTSGPVRFWAKPVGVKDGDEITVTERTLRQKLNKSIVEDIASHLKKIVELKKEGKTKELIQHHEAIDKLLHKYVGKQGLTPDEKMEKAEKLDAIDEINFKDSIGDIKQAISNTFGYNDVDKFDKIVTVLENATKKKDVEKIIKVQDTLKKLSDKVHESKDQRYGDITTSMGKFITSLNGVISKLKTTSDDKKSK